MATAEIKARASLDDKGFQAGVTRMKQSVSKFATGEIKALASTIGAAFAVRAIAGFTMESLKAADAIDNTSKQIKVGAESLQALQRQAELTTGSSEKMTAALLRINTASARAAGGMKEQQKAFADLGISAEDIQRLSPDKMFELISQKVATAGAASKETSAASKILGESYGELLEVMRTVASEGIEGLTNRMLESGEIMRGDTVKTLDFMEERWNTMTTKVGNWLKERIVDVYSFITAPSRLAAVAGAMSGGASAREAINIANEQFGLKSPETKKAASKIAIDAQTEVESKAKTSAIPTMQATDQIAKIGGILGAQGTTNQERMAREALDLQRAMNEKLERVAQYTKTTGENTAPLKEA